MFSGLQQILIWGHVGVGVVFAFGWCCVVCFFGPALATESWLGGYIQVLLVFTFSQL